MWKQTPSTNISSEKETESTVMYSNHQLAVPRQAVEHTPTAIRKERRLDCLKHLISDTSSHIRINISAALYNISKCEWKEATATLEKAKALVRMQQNRSSALLEEVSLERASHLQKIYLLSKTEIHLHRENVRLLEENKMLKMEIEKRENDLNSDDELLLGQDASAFKQQ